MNRRIVAAGLFALSTATFLLAGKPGSLVTTDGQRLEGEITETRETVTIVRHGVTSVLPREQVSEIDYATFADRFDRAIKALADEDVDGRLALAREAFDAREYELAQKAVDAAIDINPLSRPAMEMSRAIANQLTLEATTRKPATRPASQPRVENPSGERRHYRGLAPDQINVVRQMELQAGDQVRVQFRNNSRKAFVDSQPGLSFRDFNTLTDAAQAIQVIEHGSPELKRDVIILSDPQSIQTFGRRLHTAIVQGCATSQCHGGTSSGGFKLLSGTPDPSTLVTNFYLLTQFRKQNDNTSGSVFAPSIYHMIDRGHARDSMMFQFLLPRSKARLKHPEVRSWDGLVTHETDRLAVDVETWMNKDLVQVTPDYGFDFSILDTTRPSTSPAEVEPATTQPAAQPSTSPTE